MSDSPAPAPSATPSPNAANVSVGKPKAGGGIFAAPYGTPVPTDAVANLDAKFVPLGYVSDSGIVNSISTDTASINAWGGDEVLNVRTSRSESFKFTFIETNTETLKQVYGAGNVTESKTGELTVLHNSKELPRVSYVFEILLSGGRVKRIVVENARVSEVGDVTYVDGEAIGYEVTLGAYPNKDANTAVEYIAKLAV